MAEMTLNIKNDLKKEQNIGAKIVLDIETDASTVNIESSKPDIVRANEDDRTLEMLQEGKSTITVTAVGKDGKSDKIVRQEVTVGNKTGAIATTLVVNDKPKTLKLGQSYKVVAQTNAKDYTLASSNEKIAYVDNTNKTIHTISNGAFDVTVTAKHENSLKEVTVTWNIKVEGVLDPGNDGGKPARIELYNKNTKRTTIIQTSNTKTTTDLTYILPSTPGTLVTEESLKGNVSILDTPKILTPTSGTTNYKGTIIASDPVFNMGLREDLLYSLWEAAEDDQFTKVIERKKITYGTLSEVMFSLANTTVFIRVKYYSKQYSSEWSTAIKVTYAHTGREEGSQHKIIKSLADQKVHLFGNIPANELNTTANYRGEWNKILEYTKKFPSAQIAKNFFPGYVVQVDDGSLWRYTGTGAYDFTNNRQHPAALSGDTEYNIKDTLIIKNDIPTLQVNVKYKPTVEYTGEDYTLTSSDDKIIKIQGKELMPLVSGTAMITFKMLPKKGKLPVTIDVKYTVSTSAVVPTIAGVTVTGLPESINKAKPVVVDGNPVDKTKTVLNNTPTGDAASGVSFAYKVYDSSGTEVAGFASIANESVEVKPAAGDQAAVTETRPVLSSFRNGHGYVELTATKSGALTRYIKAYGQTGWEGTWALNKAYLPSLKELWRLSMLGMGLANDNDDQLSTGDANVGESANLDETYIKYIYNGRICYTPKKPIGLKLAWTDLAKAELVYGDKTIVSSGIPYIIRLMREAESKALFDNLTNGKLAKENFKDLGLDQEAWIEDKRLGAGRYTMVTTIPPKPDAKDIIASPVDIDLGYKPTVLYMGKTFTMAPAYETNTTYTLESSDPETVEVTGNTTLNPKKTGSVTLKVIAKAPGKTETVITWAVKVEDPATIKTTMLHVTGLVRGIVDQTMQLVIETDAADFELTSSYTGKLTVNKANKQLIAVAPGKANITIKAKADGKSETIIKHTVEVRAASTTSATPATVLTVGNKYGKVQVTQSFFLDYYTDASTDLNALKIEVSNNKALVVEQAADPDDGNKTKWKFTAKAIATVDITIKATKANATEGVVSWKMSIIDNILTVSKNNRDLKARLYAWRPVLEFIAPGDEPFYRTPIEAPGTISTLKYDKYTDTGYYGVVNMQDFGIDAEQLCAEVNYIEGTFNSLPIRWYKFYSHGKLVYLPNRAVRHTGCNYWTLRTANLTCGYDLMANGKEAIVKLNKLSYYVSLPTGGTSNPYMYNGDFITGLTTTQSWYGDLSNWNELFYRIHKGFVPGESTDDGNSYSTTSPYGVQIGNNFADLNANFTDLYVRYDKSSGSAALCRETLYSSGDILWRGYNSVGAGGNTGINYVNSGCGWWPRLDYTLVPVLEESAKEASGDELTPTPDSK